MLRISGLRAFFSVRFAQKSRIERLSISGDRSAGHAQLLGSNEGATLDGGGRAAPLRSLSASAVGTHDYASPKRVGRSSSHPDARPHWPQAPMNAVFAKELHRVTLSAISYSSHGDSPDSASTSAGTARAPRASSALQVARRRDVRTGAVMGTSLEMIERAYGHLVTGADDAFRSRLDSYGKLAEVIAFGRPQ